MLLVKTTIKVSQIHGLGLFADEPIAAGAVVWRFVDGFDRFIDQNDIEAWPPIAQRHIFHYCALLRNGKFLVAGDNDRFWNHSDNPNCITDEEPGEELTDNYLQYPFAEEPGSQKLERTGEGR